MEDGVHVCRTRMYVDHNGREGDQLAPSLHVSLCVIGGRPFVLPLEGACEVKYSGAGPSTYQVLARFQLLGVIE